MPDALQTQRRTLLAELFRNYSSPAFAIRLWNDWQWSSIPGEKPMFTLAVETPNALAALAQCRIDDAKLARRCTVELLDYRNCAHLSGSFDKIASVGMFEHVGPKNLPHYFHTVHKLLRPGGTFLNHGIARSALSPVRKDSFIDRYVFPDGRLATLSQAVGAAESAGFEVRDVENLREHYELTLRKWVEGLRQNEEELRNYVAEKTYRIWLLYMAGSAAAFRRGDSAVYQILLSRPERGRSGLPLIREDWYSTSTWEQRNEI